MPKWTSLSCYWSQRKFFQLFTIEYIYIWPFTVEVASLYEHFLKNFFFFIINEGRILLKAYSASTYIIIWYLFFSLLMCCITLIDMQILKNLCIPEINSTWSWCVILLIYCWIRFANILLMILHLCLSVILACNSLFCVISLSGFGIRVIVASLNEFGSISSSAVFWNSFRRIGVNSSLNAW